MPDAGWEQIYERSLDCVHCGLCLPACPTYIETGRESSSPRGRIYLFRAVAEGRLPVTEAVADEAYLCLGCRACETACPSGVRFGSMVEMARAQVEQAPLRRSWAKRWAKRIERWVLRFVVPHRRRLGWAITLLGATQRSGLDRLAVLLPAGLRELHALAPQVPPASDRGRLPERTAAVGEKRGTVAFFVGCVMPELFGAVNAATVRVLARNGFEVVVPSEQGCCGALHAHAGDLEFAHGLARVNLDAFADADVVVTNSAGCGAALRDLEDWLPGQGGALSRRVRDVAEFLDEEGIRVPEARLEARVCYDDPCHLVHGQRVEAAPRRLLTAIPGIELVDHANPGSCCGAAGIYNLTHREMSDAVLDRKISALSDADPDYVATGNPGCLMQIQRGAAQAGLGAEVVHPIELLDRAYRASVVAD